MTHTDALNTLKQRIQADRMLFFITPTATPFADRLLLSRRKRLYGLTLADGTPLLPPVYDHITLLHPNPCTISLRIGTNCAAATIDNDGAVMMLTQFDYTALIPGQGHTIHLQSPTGLLGALFTDTHALTPTIYDMISPDPGDAPYIWAHRQNLYGYIDRTTGREIIMSLTMAYDHPTAMAGISATGQVIMINPQGHEDPTLLRQATLRAHGCITLQNHTLQIEHRVDPYGNILNPPN